MTTRLRTMKTNNILLTALAACTVTANAQDLTTEITVESSVEAELPPASPLQSVFPSLLQRPATDIKLRPAQYNEAVDYATAAGNGAPALFAGTQTPDRHRGYVWAGYFPAYNVSAAAGYKIIDTETTLTGVSASFDGYSYSPEDVTVSNNTFRARAYAGHRFDRGATVSADVSYMYSAINSPVSFGKHDINAFDLSVGVSGEGAVEYKASAAYSRFGLDNELVPGMTWYDEFDPSDDRFTIKSEAAHRFGEERRQRIALGVDFDLLHRHGIRTSENSYAYEPYKHSSTGLLRFNPAYEISTHKAMLRIGLKADIAINPDNKAFHIAPDVMLAWMPRHEFTAYATVGGGEQFRTLRDLYAYSPFAPNYAASSRSFTPFDGRIGVTVQPLSSFSAGLWGGYSSTRRMPMPTVLGYNTVTFAPVDLSGWQMGIEASYSYNKYLSASINGRLYQQGYCKGSADNIDRARAVLGIELKSSPVERLNLTVAYELRACRAYYSSFAIIDNNADAPVMIHEKYGMGNISNLSVGGNYRLTDAISVFAKVENILCRRTLILPGVQSRRMHGLVGASLLF